MKDPLQRIKPIEYLADRYDAEVDVAAICEREQSAFIAKQAINAIPTIGCEIEVKWSSIFPEVARKYFGELDKFDRFERTYYDLAPEEQKELSNITAVHRDALMPEYQATVEAGIPAGSDAFWELANAPAYDARTLAKEVELLFEANLIPENYHLALHITLGSLALGKGGAHMILSGLELLHGKPERILLATEGSKHNTAHSWARRGQEGICQRNSSYLQLGASVGVELRTLTITSKEDANRIFCNAQILGAVLLAHRGLSFMPSSQPDYLGELWSSFTKAIKNLWSASQVPNAPWGMPHHNPTPWRNWADTIEQTSDTDSLPARTVQTIESLICQAKDILLDSDERGQLPTPTL